MIDYFTILLQLYNVNDICHVNDVCYIMAAVYPTTKIITIIKLNICSFSFFLNLN